MSAEPGSSPTPLSTPPRRRTAWGRELAAFCAVALLVLLAVSAGTVWLSEGIARDNALEEAEGMGGGLAGLLGAPLLADALAGGPGGGGGGARDGRDPGGGGVGERLG